MMCKIKIKYNGEILEKTVDEYFGHVVNRIYKLLPLREENSDWKSYLTSLLEELTGADEILLNSYSFLSLINQLEGLFIVNDDKLYRKTVLGCISKAKSLNTRGV